MRMKSISTVAAAAGAVEVRVVACAHASTCVNLGGAIAYAIRCAVSGAPAGAGVEAAGTPVSSPEAPPPHAASSRVEASVAAANDFRDFMQRAPALGSIL